MFETSNLVPNLNKIMEEYAKGDQEVVQATQVEIGQEEERTEVITEGEQSIEETKKRKRGVEETGVE